MDKLVLNHEWQDNGKPRTDKLSMIVKDGYIQVYIENGKTVEGKRLYGSFRMNNEEKDNLMDWLENV